MSIFPSKYELNQAFTLSHSTTYFPSQDHSTCDSSLTLHMLWTNISSIVPPQYVFPQPKSLLFPYHHPPRPTHTVYRIRYNFPYLALVYIPILFLKRNLI